jgi:hypothetical protein
MKICYDVAAGYCIEEGTAEVSTSAVAETRLELDSPRIQI